MPVKLSYSESSYEIIKQELIDSIPELTANWTDFNDSDVSMALVDLMAKLSDYSSFRRDKIVRELLLPRARERKNVKALLSLVGYKMHGHLSNSCEAELSLAVPHIADVEFPAYTQFSIQGTDESELVKFSNLEPITLYKGETSRTTVLLQGSVAKYEYRLGDIIEGRIYLPDKSIGSNTVRVETSNDDSSNAQVLVWEEVEDIVQVPEAGLYFSHDTSDEDEEYIDLYPIYKSTLNENTIINISYLVTRGPDGYVGSGKVVEVDEPLYDVHGQEVTDVISIVNTTVANGGADPETIEVAKRNAQVFVKTMETLVTLEDYKNVIETHPTVLKCNALDWNYPISGILEGYHVKAYAVPAEGNTVDEVFKDKIKEYINPKRMTGLKVDVVEASYLDLTLGVTVYVRQRSLYKDRVKNSTTSKLLEIFDQQSLDFEQSMYLSEILSKLQSADPEIVKVELSGVSTDINPSMIEVVRLIGYEIQVMEV